MKITNHHDISLPLAVWLLQDNYDYVNDTNYISATSLLRPTKQIILAKSVLAEDKEMDISERIALTFGNAVHDSVEKAWTNDAGRKAAMRKLGYPDQVVDNIVVNPSEEYLAEHPDAFCVWFEQRAIKEIAGFKVGGKFDTIIDGHLFDYKTTSTFSYLSGNKDDDYSLQGSIYRWLNPELITDPFIYINFIFTDWQKFMTKSNPDYPKLKLLEHPVPLISIEETEKFIVDKLNEIARLWNKPESELPPCTDKELWRSDPKYKYYADPAKANEGGRSTKNFDELREANDFMNEKGKGVVITIPGEVKACGYCPAYSNCKQKDQYNV